ncbi:sigma-70 family RNA polymerase sigma factor [Orrella sp. JC864]|uniref:RNA polymerase sigma factor n=1 Tax=Orrella sp. JC864 TaxID=3120298 RepID=UPI001429C559
MSNEGIAALRELFSSRYRALRYSVARRLGGAAEAAEDALHEAYVRLADKGGLQNVRHPVSYLVNTAVHVGIDRMRGESRELSEGEIAHFLDVPDSAPTPPQVAADRQRMALLQDVMQQLPARQLDILLALRVHGTTRADVARRWGISERQVARELLAAHKFCASALNDEND